MQGGRARGSSAVWMCSKICLRDRFGRLTARGGRSGYTLSPAVRPASAPQLHAAFGKQGGPMQDDRSAAWPQHVPALQETSGEEHPGRRMEAGPDRRRTAEGQRRSLPRPAGLPARTGMLVSPQRQQRRGAAPYVERQRAAPGSGPFVGSPAEQVRNGWAGGYTLGLIHAASDRPPDVAKGLRKSGRPLLPARTKACTNTTRRRSRS